MDSTQTDNFSVKSGVRQGCIISPILFNITLDYIMRQSTQNARHGIQWTMFSQLEELDYADNSALLSTNARHLQQKANVLNENAKKAGVHINMKNTKVMHLNLTGPHPQIMIDGDIWEATLVPRTVFRRISQLELTKQETEIATSVIYGNQTYIA